MDLQTTLMSFDDFLVRKRQERQLDCRERELCNESYISLKYFTCREYINLYKKEYNM